MRNPVRGVVAGTLGFFSGGLAYALLQQNDWGNSWMRAVVVALVTAIVAALLLWKLPHAPARE